MTWASCSVGLGWGEFGVRGDLAFFALSEESLADDFLHRWAGGVAEVFEFDPYAVLIGWVHGFHSIISQCPVFLEPIRFRKPRVFSLEMLRITVVRSFPVDRAKSS